MIQKIDITSLQHAAQVLELQRKSYRIEAAIIGFQQIPPLLETLEELTACEEEFYGYYLEDILVGIISFKIKEQVLDIHRVAISPEHFKKGIAAKLLLFLENKYSDLEKFIVSTGKKNFPAVSLYQKHGFGLTKEEEIAENLTIVSFEKRIGKQE